MATKKILIVEGEHVVALNIEHQLINLGYSVVGITGSGEEAVHLAVELQPDLVLMDICLSGKIDGVDAADQIRRHWSVPVIFLTAHADDDTLRRASATEPFGYILKPFKERELRPIIELALYKHEAERKLRDREHWYSVTLESIADAVITTDNDGRITLMNRVAESITGWSRAEAAGRSLSEVVRVMNEVTQQPVEDPVTEVLRTRRPALLTNQTTLIARDGHLVPIDDSGAPIQTAEGRTLGVVLVVRDVTERRRTEQEIQRQLQELQLWHSTSLNREERIYALKQEVNELLAELRRPIRYA